MTFELGTYPEELGAAVTDVATAWDARMEQVMRRGGAIFAFRGAGSTGGIDPEAADRAIEQALIPRIDESLGRYPVALMYDGDPDDPAKPDIGYVFGRLRDRYDGHDRVDFFTAQADDWYYPPQPGSNLANAHGRPSETYVFPRGTYIGDHNRFTQSDKLVRYPRYGQIYVGAAGMLAADQLTDYAARVPAGQAPNVTLVRALINHSLDDEIGAKLAAATTDAQRQKFANMLEQRRRLYGQHWDNSGRLVPEFEAQIHHETDTHKAVVLWDGADTVEVVNAHKIDLQSPEYNERFARAGYFVKSKPFQARQVPAGTSELIVVKSGATRDTVYGGDWVAKTSGTGEDYPVAAATFAEVAKPIADQPGWFRPIGAPRKLVEVDEDVIFMAPWGEEQAVRRGGFLIERIITTGPKAGQNEHYGIARRDVIGDFVPYHAT